MATSPQNPWDYGRSQPGSGSHRDGAKEGVERDVRREGENTYGGDMCVCGGIFNTPDDYITLVFVSQKG